MRPRDPAHPESGQTIVVFAVFLVVLLCFVGVLIDGGMYYVERRNMQGVADAAALAAVRELPRSSSRASAAATEYVGTRNSTSHGIIRSLQFSDANRQVSIRVGKTGTQSFGALLGMTAPEIGAHATARVQMMGARSGMLPIAFMRDRFTIGNNEEIKWDDPGGGNRGAIAPEKKPNCSEASGANDFRDLIKGAARGGIDACATPIAATLDTEPGAMSGPTRQGFDARLSGNSQSFSDVFKTDPVTGFHTIEDPTSPRIGIVPIIENSNGTNTWPRGRSAPVRIIGYMLVYIGNRNAAGNPAYTRNGQSVWVTPVRPLLPEDFEDGAFVDYNESLPSPVVFRLTE